LKTEKREEGLESMVGIRRNVESLFRVLDGSLNRSIVRVPVERSGRVWLSRRGGSGRDERETDGGKAIEVVVERFVCAVWTVER